MHLGSIRAIDRPTSACEKASATFSFISLFLIINPPITYFISIIKVKKIFIIPDKFYLYLVNSCYFNIVGSTI